MTQIRPFRESDIQAIDTIWRAHHADAFSVPDRSTALVDAVVENKDKVVAYGQVKLFAEAMFIVDKDASLRDKVNALKLLMSEAFYGMDKAGLNRCTALFKIQILHF